MSMTERRLSDNDRDIMATAADKDTPVPFDLLKAYLSEVSKYPVLSREQEFAIARSVFEQDDQEAAQKLAMSNLKLVVKIALEYYNAYLNILDVIQEGNVGLLHAVKKFNPYKGTKFSTYASFWIRAYILKYIMDSWSLVKVGTTQSQRKLFYGLNKEKRKLESLGVYPSPKILAVSLGVKEGEVAEMQQRLASLDLSLETPVHDESDDTIMDLMSSDENVEEIVSASEESDIISRKIVQLKSTLNDKEAFILDHRVISEEPETLQEIGARFQISRERVRQIEGRVVKKLKESFREERTAFSM